MFKKILKPNIFKLIKKGDLNAVKAHLKKYPEDMNACKNNHEKSSPVHFSIDSSKLDIFKYLIEQKAPIDEQTVWEHSPLHRTVWQKKYEYMRILIRAGADLNLTDYDGESALIKAVRNGDSIAAKILIDAGADQEIADNDGKKASDHANSTEMKTLLGVKITPPQGHQTPKGFNLEDDSCVSLTKVMNTADLSVTTVYDFEFETITTITQSDKGQSHCVNSFERAASKAQLQAAKDFWAEQKNTADGAKAALQVIS